MSIDRRLVVISRNTNVYIDALHARTLEEIMLEILDGNQDALELLQDNARSCTPRDLTILKSAPGMLLDAMT